MEKKPKRLLILTILALLMQMTLFCGTVYGEGPTIDVEADKYYAFDGTDSGVTNKAYPNGDPTYEGDDTYGNMMAVGHDGPYGTEIVALKFNLPVFEKTVGKAILKIYIFEIPDSSKNPFITVSGSSKDDWAEDYNLADLPDTDVDLGAVATEVPITAIGWQEFDVTNFFADEAAEDGTATFVLTGLTSGDQSDVFTYDKAKAGFGAYLEITYANIAPVLAAIGDKTVDEGSELTFTAQGTDEDDNDLTYSLEGTVPDGASINALTGAFNWTPAEAQGPDSHTFTIRVTDNGTPSLSDSEDITVTVNEVNTAPVLAGIGNKTIDEGTELAFTASATDADLPANTLTYSLVDAPAGASINGTTGEFSWTPAEEALDDNTYTFTVKVTDNGTGSLTDEEEITVTVNKVNNAPVLDPIGNQTVNEGSELTFMVSSSAVDIPADTLTYGLEGNVPAGAAINAATGVFSWTPTEAQGPGSYTFTVKVTDDGTPSLSDSEEITVTVNEINTAPVLNAIGNKTVDEGSALTFTATATDEDVPANSFTYSLAGIVPDGASINAASGAFNWIPAEVQGPGSYTFTIKVTDSEGGSDSEVITVTVNEVNTAPVLAAIGNKTVDEGTELTFTVSATDADLPANALTYSLDGAPEGAAINGATGEFNWTPAEAQGGNDYTFTVKVMDSEGSSDSEEITVTVAKVNNAPVLAAIGNKTVNELSTLTFTAIGTDIDIPADTLTYSLEGAVPNGAAIDASLGEFSWTPTEAQGPGTYTFTVKATDDGNPNLSDEEEITVTVNEVNTSPVLEAIGNKTVNELNSLSFTVSATDIDLPANTLTYSLEGAVPAGSVINAATGVFRWIPTEAQGGSDYTFTVKVADGGNPSLSDEEEITVTVNEVNMAPTLDPLINLSLSSGAGLQTVNLTGISAGGNETQGIDVTASAGNTTLIPAITVSYTSPETTGTLTFIPQGIGTAVVTVTVTDDGGTDNGGVNTTTRTFTVTVASHDRDSDDDDRSEGGRTDTPVVNTIITPVMDTDDDKDLNNNLAQQGAAVLNISGDADAKAALSSDVVNALSQAEMPLTIENQGIKVEFSPAALVVPALQDAQGVVEIGVREVTWAEKEDVLAAANLGESTGLFEIGGKMIELTAQVVTTTSDGAVVTNKVESFSEPVAVTIDLSGLNFTPEMIAELTGVRYEKDAAGNIVPIKLGGTFDPVTRCFTFYTDRFSYYSVLRADSLVQIHLTVDISAVTINGAGKILDVAPTIINSYTMVPVRFVSEALGAAVEWQENTKTVVIKLNGQELSLAIGQTGPGLDIPAQIVSGRTMVPLSYVSKFLGAYVKWFPGERKVEIIK